MDFYYAIKNVIQSNSTNTIDKIILYKFYYTVC